MAWEASDWAKSGIRDTYRWVMCDNRTMAEIEDLTGFREARISASYEGDLKFTGTVDVSGSNFVTGRLLRCYHTATLESEGKSKTTCLGTFFVDNDDLTYLHGRYSGSMQLSSMLLRFTEARDTTPWTFTKGKSALSSWWQLMQSEGAKNYSTVSVKDANWKKTEVVDFGETRIKTMNVVADFLKAQVGVNPKGYITLTPYVAPKDKPVSWSVPYGASSLVFEGVNVNVNRSNCVNRYSVLYEQSVEQKVQDGVYKAKYTDSNNVTHQKGDPKFKTTKVKVPIYGCAELEESNAYSFAKRGRHVDETETLQNMTPETKDRANEIAKQRLGRYSRGSVQYTFDSYYMPYTIGDVIRFTYRDNEAAKGIDVDGIVTNIEYTLGLTGLRMQTTIRKVRSR